MRRLKAVCAVAVAFGALGASLTAFAPPAAQAAPAAGFAKGIIDSRLGASAGEAGRGAAVTEVSSDLGAGWTRLVAHWSRLEPVRGEYDQAQLALLDAAVAELHQANVSVILTTCYLPAWAQATAAEARAAGVAPPAAGGAPATRSGDPRADFISRGALPDYERFAYLLAQRYAGQVTALECWNEPNLWTYLYPQRAPGDPYFGARTYLRMLRAFHHGVARATSHLLVIAGATAPIGTNDRLRTSPQRFARFLHRRGAARLFDAYSHHPYTPGATLHPAPDGPPNNPATTVTLANLGTLLRVFPHKPFYLTEYGYNTEPSVDYGGFSVSDVAQARYLARAFAMAARHRQVRTLLWFLVTDARPASGPADLGVYTGLRRSSGERKPSWYAFANLSR